MAGLGWQELVIVLVIIMIIFGAGKLPEIAKSLGQGVKEFREEASAPVVPATTATASRVDDLKASASAATAESYSLCAFCTDRPEMASAMDFFPSKS